MHYQTSRELRRFVAIGIIQFVSLSTAAASSVITVPYVQALPNTAGQQFDIYISGDDMISQLDFFMTVNNGGVGPVITAVDVIGPGTLFASNNTGLILFGAPNNPPSTQIAAGTTTYSSAKLLADGLLARITYDTTGVPIGVYSVSLTNHPFGPTELGVDDNDNFIFPEIHNGFIDVPEPSSVALAAIGLASIAVCYLRRRK